MSSLYTRYRNPSVGMYSTTHRTHTHNPGFSGRISSELVHYVHSQPPTRLTPLLHCSKTANKRKHVTSTNHSDKQRTLPV